MQIRRYTGPELASVLRQIDRELGPSAAIISTRSIHQGGFFGMMGRPAVEVTVAVDYNFRLPEDSRGHQLQASMLKDPAATPVMPPMARERQAPMDDVRIAARRELDQMRVRPRGGTSYQEPAQSLSEDLERVHRMLVRNQVEADISRQLLRVFDEQLALLGEDWAKAQPRFERYLAGMIRTQPGIQLRDSRKPLVAMFIGPTGTGKTTTIAKIASRFALSEHRRVAIVTADTYRLGATDQMRRFGEIMGVPVKVVETPEDMEETLGQFAGYDLVLVDTAGRSPQNRDQIMQMRRMVESVRADEIHLVVSMTTKYVDVVSIVSRFGIVPVNKVILTKFDETRAFGLILNISVRFSMEIAYITTGQQVPDDIEPADPQRLSKLVLAGIGDRDGRPGLAAA